MKPDLKSMSRKELEKLKADVEKALTKITEKELKEARAAAEKAAAQYGVSLADLMGGPAPKPRGRKAKSGPKTKSAPKFRNPADASQTWTGKGRQPEWYKAEIAKGTDPKSMAI